MPCPCRLLLVLWDRRRFKGVSTWVQEMGFQAHIEQDEDGCFVATCPSLPGCVSQGVTKSGALRNIREAMEAYIESLRKHNESIPPGIEDGPVSAKPGAVR